MRIVFHGENAASFSNGFAEMAGPGAEIAILPDTLTTGTDRGLFANADVIVGNRFTASHPRPSNLRLYHLPAAGYDGVDLNAVPPAAVVCNCFGHEPAIAEYVMAAVLQRAVPIADADQRLRQGDWKWWAGAPERTHPEIAGSTIGILGFGHIGKAIAARAFGMNVHVANRSPVTPELADQVYTLSELPAFWSSADVFVVTVPLAPETQSLVGANAFARMRPHAVLINVARGPVVDEQALYNALRDNRIGGAIIDTWYRYPNPADPRGAPASLPFHELPNIVMTPHMSGWTMGTIRRRQQTIADNIGRVLRGESCENIIRAASD